MQVSINEGLCTLPSSLSEFTLGQRIDFQQQYGNGLDKWYNHISEMPDGIERDMEIVEYQFEKMFQTFAFFSGCTVEAVKTSEYLDDIANIYHSCLAVLFETEEQIELRQEYFWNNETWHLHPPELKHGSKMTFGEFIDAKQIVKDLTDLGNSHWDKLLRLCAIYLRKTGEEYSDHFVYEDSERINLMKSLPMDIALAVAFFLTASMNLCIQHFRYSMQVE